MRVVTSPSETMIRRLTGLHQRRPRLTLVGTLIRYAVHDRNGWPLAMLDFSTAAWKLAPRDNFIGWTPQLREKNLPLMVDNLTHASPRTPTSSERCSGP